MNELITSTVEASADVHDEALMQDGVETMVAAKLAKLITQKLHDHGYPVPEVTRNDMIISQINDPGRMTTTLTAWYSPDPRRGVKFVGGPMDGTVRPLNSAPSLVDLPGLAQQPATELDADSQPSPSEHYAYSPAGVDPVEGIWVYEYTPTRRTEQS